MTNHCGTCTACCRVFAIPDFNKPAGKWCEHCAIGSGCKIYEARPQRCVDYECLWLISQGAVDPRHRLADALRPDRCKVVFTPTTNENIMAAVPLPGSHLAWRRKDVARLIDSMVSNGMKVAITPVGADTSTLINKSGEHEVEMTEPDETGMRWSKRK